MCAIWAVTILGAWYFSTHSFSILLATFWTNPQYKVRVPGPDEGNKEGKGLLIVGLTQKERRKMRREGKSYLTMGWAVYKVRNSFHS